MGRPLPSPLTKLILLLAVAACGCGCKDQQKNATVSLPRGDSLAISLGDSTAWIPTHSGRSFRLRTTRGIVFATSSDSLAPLAIESANRKVFILVGIKAESLRAYKHQKIEMTGFWRPASAASGRDTLEVADYTLLRE